MSGQKFDSGKPRFSLVPHKALTEVIQVLEFGANKYSPDNWRKVPQLRQRYLDAGFRHYMEALHSPTNDHESGRASLAHAICCLLFVLERDLEDAEQKDVGLRTDGDFSRIDIIGQNGNDGLHYSETTEEADHGEGQ